tara:strand:+ start:424 stop:666 length:243 start_codon:yes stop_codon:yes gene_type:complete
MVEPTEELINIVEHLSQHKTLKEVFKFTKSLYEYVSILYDCDYTTEESESDEEEDIALSHNIAAEHYKIKKDKDGFYSLD